MTTSKRIGFFLGPSLFILLYFFFPAHLISPAAPKVLALAAWMLTWWITEAAPIPVTAFLPLVGFPLLGVMKIGQSTAPYANPVIFLFMGGFMIALALEKHKLHERIALKLIKLTGTSGNGIILGFMLASALLSMWISNTATAMMMLPIAVSVVHLILHDVKNLNELDNKRERNFAIGLMLSIGYACSLGGMATIIGTPPNVVFVGLLNDFYGIKISFAQWLIVGFPVATILVLANYVLVTRVLFPNKLEKIKGSEELIAKRLQALGPIRKEEKLVLIIFSLTAFLWMFQQPINAVLKLELLNDTIVAMCGGLLMFIVPVDFKKGEFVLHWSDTEKLAWGILFLFGGGLCLAEGLDKSGIIPAVGQWIGGHSEFSIGLTLILIVISVYLSEVMSNVALVNVFVPVVFGIANVMEVNPILMGLPVTLGASIALMFPIATPPNAIVFSSGYIRIQDMVRAGFWLNIVSILIIWVFSITLVNWLFL
ncbi:MAG: DASS family sodium-coupled anion symporter [Cyclobacteriaceae bacterium]|nr:DASS family sodium-coupled anion symporter [Cyclobacteriaceae bacterium]UYN87901.1 MAG: DASS family sodium-coupled anion symporter [Cyclobacteriaceae bacterium]